MDIAVQHFYRTYEASNCLYTTITEVCTRGPRGSRTHSVMPRCMARPSQRKGWTGGLGNVSNTRNLAIRIGDYMSRITNSKSTSANARRKRVIKVAPMTRAVRMALAASLAALALGASGGAFAANCSAPATVMTPCKATSIDAAPVADLTLVHAAAPLARHGAFIMPLAINQ